MKIGLVPVNIGVSNPEQMVAIAIRAEQLGFESVWTFEHVIVPLAYTSRYPYNPDGKMGAAPETPFVDPLIALAFLAGHTKTLRLGTGVNILPQANPLMLAKQAASLDFASQGRLLLGLGTGWLREEYEALGTPFERRGARFDDYIRAIKQVWSGAVVEHESEFLHWHGFKSYPLPIQKPHVPVLIGGNTRPALQRVARHGQGWLAPRAPLDVFKQQVATVHELARENGRAPESIEISVMSANVDGELLRRYEELGVQRVIVFVPALGSADPTAGLEALADKLVAR